MRGPVENGRHVIVIGAGSAAQAAVAELTAAGIDFLVLDETPGSEIVSSVFDDAADTWALRTAAGDVFRTRVVIAADRPPTVPWIPDIPGRNDFRGVSFHTARWDPDFDPGGKRIAVVGGDSATGHHIGRLTESAADVTVFAHMPRRIVFELPLPATRAARWLRRHIRPDARPRPAHVGSAIDSITASGIRTCDGVGHRADAIIYGTGFTIADRIADDTLVGAGGLSIRQAWDDGMEPYFGVAVHGFPNYFFLTGPDIGAQARYGVDCLRVMERSATTRIEVLRSSQRVFNERACLHPAQPQPVPAAFDLSGADEDAYDGAATLTVAGVEHPVRVRLAGHLDPIDGRFHWQGTVFGTSSRPLPDDVVKQARTATLTVGECSAPARIVEQTPWGAHSVAGVGAPPYASS